MSTSRAVGFMAFLASRAVVWAAGLLAIATVGVSADRDAYDPAGLTAPFGTVGDTLIGPAARWDASWYLAIADHGYGDDPARPAFFPLYPLTVALVSFVVRGPTVAGILVSCGCLLAALVLLHRLTELELDRPAATATTWLVAFGPMSLFFSAIYSESLFLLTSIASLLSARRDRWALAGFLALLAALTRSVGVVLFIPLAVLAWDSGQRSRIGWALLPLAGPAAFAAYLEIDGPGWRAAFDAQRIWGREFAGPFVAAWDGATAAGHGAVDILRDGGGRLARQNVLFFAFLVLAVTSLIGVCRRLPRAYGIWVLAALTLPLSYPVDGRPLLSLPRFVAVMFPLWMWLGWWVTRGERWRPPLIWGASVVGLGAFSALFSTWRFVS